MTIFEYKVVPAPKKGQKGKGVKGGQERFANALMVVMNELGADGWEYQRCDTLPCEERSGLTGKTTVYQNMLVFRRAQPMINQAPAAEVTDETRTEPAVESIAQTHAPLLETTHFESLRSETSLRSAILGGPDSKADEVAAE